MTDAEKGWYITHTGRRVEIIAVDEVREAAGENYFEVAAYRYEGRDYVHVRATAEIEWEREPEKPELTLEDRVAELERRLNER